MVSISGHILLIAALFLNILSIVNLLLGRKRNDSRWQRTVQYGLFIAAGLLLVGLIVLCAAFLADHFKIIYVAQHSSRDLPFYLKIAAIWAGQEGSLLLWSFLQVLFAAIVSTKINNDGTDLARWSTVILAVISAFFISMTLLFSNPFLASSSPPLDGQGMNPLLRHPGMIFHPPILYIGYVGLAVPFAYALSALITQQVEIWYRKISGWLLLSWLALGVGIILGSRWAYDVLGWGGYWGWDAVENAGLMPWLTATALLHGISEQKRGKGFKIWNIILSAFSFWLVIFGTFTTRSGLIQSVHAFAQSQLGPYFLVMLGAIFLGTLILMIIFQKSLGEPVYPEKVISREGAGFFTLLLLVLITLSILAGTLLPTLTDGRFSAPASWFNRVVGPQFGALVLLMGICPLLGRFGRSIKTKKWRLLFPIAGLILVPMLAFINGLEQTFSLIGFAVSGFAGGTALGEIVYNLERRKSRQQTENQMQSSGRSRYKPYGGYLVHFGIVLMAVGIIGTQVYAFDDNISISPGSVSDVGDYTLVYEDMFQQTQADRIETWVAISVYREDSFLTTLNPQITFYPYYNQAMAEPAIRSGIGEDLYLVLFQWDDSGEISLSVKVNPLSSFLWMGSLVLVVGGMIAWWPEERSERSQVFLKRKWLRNLGIFIGISLIRLFTVTLWGNPFDSTGSIGRPLPGDSAPKIEGQDYIGNGFSLADYKGKPVLVHFWASWCSQCEEELILLEKFWQGEEYKYILFVGVALNDTQRTVEQIARDLELSFILIPDENGDISRSYGVTAVPETFFISPDGRIQNFHIGVMREQDLMSALENLKTYSDHQ